MISPLLLAAIPALIQGGVGVAQMIKGKRMGKNLKDPEMPIPQSAIEALQNARVMASRSNMPGYENQVMNMNQILSGAVGQINRSATSSQEGLGAILNAVGMQTKAANDIGISNAQHYDNSQRELRNQLGNMAGFENQKWGNDVLNPFLRQATAAQALSGAGMQNTFSGLSDLSGIGAYGIKSGAFTGTPKTTTTPNMSNPPSDFTGKEVQMQYDPATGQWIYPGTTMPSWDTGNSAPLIPAIYSENPYG